jgi:hypothetical protein
MQEIGYRARDYVTCRRERRSVLVPAHSPRVSVRR